MAVPWPATSHWPIFWRPARHNVAWPGLVALFLAGVLPVLAGLVQTFFFPDTLTDSPAVVQDSRWLECLFAIAICLVMTWSAWMAWRPSPARRTRRTAFLLVLGGLFVLSSLFLATTVPTNYDQGSNGPGWQVLDRQEQWITGQASVGQSAFMGGGIKWLKPIFPAVGYPFYMLTIFATIAVLIVVASFDSRSGIARPRRLSRD